MLSPVTNRLLLFAVGNPAIRSSHHANPADSQIWGGLSGILASHSSFSGGISADPQLENASAGLFSPDASSPVIDAGSRFDFVTEDFYGLAIENQPDLGAIEYR